MNSVGESSNPKIVFYKIQYLNYYSCIIMASPQGNLEAIKENGKIYGWFFLNAYLFKYFAFAIILYVLHVSNLAQRNC